MGCVGCHQLGQLATRTLPPSLGKFNTWHDAWVRRISVRPGRQPDMLPTAMNQFGGVPLRNTFGRDGPRSARRAARTTPPLPHGVERNVIVTTVHDWLDPQAYMHDLSGTARRHPTVNGYRAAVRCAGALHRRLPDPRPKDQHREQVPCTVRDANTPTTHDDRPRTVPVLGQRPHHGQQSERASDARCPRGRVWYTARIRAAPEQLPRLQARLGSSTGESLSPERSGPPARGVRAGHKEVRLRRHLSRHTTAFVSRSGDPERHAMDQRRAAQVMDRFDHEEVQRRRRCRRRSQGWSPSTQQWQARRLGGRGSLCRREARRAYRCRVYLR